MGVNLTPILIPDICRFPTLAGKKLVVDGCNLLFHYINKIRNIENEILYNKNGDPIAHIIGLFYFCINLVERRIRPIFVFDGYPPKEKRPKSPEKIQRLIKLWQLYNKQADDHKQFFQQDPLFFYDKIIADLQEFIRLIGLPVVRGLSEGEAQGSRLIQDGKASGLISDDQDSLLFGCPRVYHHLTFKEEFCTVTNLEYQLNYYHITRRQLIDIALLIGTDYNQGIRGIGPKKALQLIQEHQQLENIPDFDIPFDIDRLRALFLHPATIEAVPQFQAPNTKYLTYYLTQKGLNTRRIDRGLNRLRVAFKQLNYKQATLKVFL